jgi:hypothetical protein
MEIEAFKKENNNAYTAGLFRTPKMSLCDFLEQKPQYAAAFSDFGNLPKKCPIRAVSECNSIWICVPNPYVSKYGPICKYLLSVSSDEIGEVCSMHGKEQKCNQNSDKKT